MELLSTDPWLGLIQSVNAPAAEDPDAHWPLDLAHYTKKLRSALASHVLFEAPIPLHVFNTSLRRAHPLVEALDFTLSKWCGRVSPPSSGDLPILPIGDLCQLALLKAISGEETESFAQKILPFYRFSSLWCKESSYNEKEAIWSIALLLRSFGKFIAIPDDPDPFFMALAKLSPRWVEKKETEGWGAKLCHGPDISAVFATAGEEIPLGALYSGSVEIPAFGPQACPLNDASRFGVRKAYSDQKWAAVVSMPEVWCELAPDLPKGKLEMRFFGLKPGHPLAFALYVKARAAEIDGDVFKPKNLQRYAGISKKVMFRGRETVLGIESQTPLRMELIPLAGEGCFWNAQFLLAFEIPFLDGRISLQLEKK